MSVDIAWILHISTIDFTWFNSVILLELLFLSMFFDFVLTIHEKKNTLYLSGRAKFIRSNIP